MRSRCSSSETYAVYLRGIGDRLGTHLHRFIDPPVELSTSVVLLSLTTATRVQFIDQCLGLVLVQS